MCSYVATRWLKAAEVGDLLRISSSSVTELCRSGKLRASNVAGVWLISAPAVDEFMQAAENQRPTESVAVEPVPGEGQAS